MAQRSLMAGMSMMAVLAGWSASAPAFAGDAAPRDAANHHADVDFVDRASMANQLAVAESRLAAERAASSGVKDLARRLAGEHEAGEAALRPAAAAAGTPAPTGLDSDGRRRLAALEASNGNAFDRTYLADQLALHSNALTLYGDYMLLGTDQPMTALAIRLIPVTEAQLKAVQASSAR